jgi:hypothetical protein
MGRERIAAPWESPDAIAGALDDQTPHQFAESKEGAGRLPPARLKQDEKPADLSI